jgi:D-glycero-D-manno-heptose 1,7-bisphosphate phosphatase
MLAGHFDEGLGVWFRVPSETTPLPRPALFLDRDGVIIEDTGYLCRTSDIVLIPGAAELIAYANRQNVPVVVITNQAGIALGYYGWEEFLAVENVLGSLLAAGGAAVDAVFACPYHPDGLERWAHPAHPARKPRPGMLHAAAERMNLDLGSSWIVGDKHVDLLAGQAGGLRGGLHVLTGHGAAQRPLVSEWRPEGFEVRTGDSICDALALIDLLKLSGR